MKFFYRVLMAVCVILGLLAQASAANSGWDLSVAMNGFSFKQADKSSHPTTDVVTSRFSSLRQLKGGPNQLSALSAIGRVSRPPSPKSPEPYQNVTTVGGYSTQYAAELTFNGVSIWVLVDTGSSDTWAAQTGFECQDSTGRVHEQRSCGLAQPYIDDFGHGKVEDVHFSVHYGSGEEVHGPMGYSDLSCGGLSVAKQQVGLANHTYWHGNNVTSGVLGLAYPAMTSAYYGNIGDEAPWNVVSYSPFLTTAIAQGTIDATFSIALTKNSSGGMIAWGGLPPIPYDRETKASTDLIIANLDGGDETAWKYSFYTIIPDGMKWGTMTDEAKYPYIVDSGTTMIYCPPPLAEAIAMSFEPKAVYLYQWGLYFTECNARPPAVFAIVIGGIEFKINSADLIYSDLIDPMTGYCAIGVASGESGPYILGDVFLQNVLAVFDVGGGEMRFYARDRASQ